MSFDLNIPAGVLESDQVEFAAPSEGMLICFNNGKTLTFEEFPKWIITLTVVDMVEHPSLLKELGITEIDNASIYKYLYELWGGLDREPDIKNGRFNHGEYFEGSCRKTLPVGNGQHLTKTEISVIKLVHLPDKLIADEFNTSVHTVESHWQNIRSKTGLTSKVEIAIWALKKGIIK